MIPSFPLHHINSFQLSIYVKRIKQTNKNTKKHQTVIFTTCTGFVAIDIHPGHVAAAATISRRQMFNI